MCGQSHIWASGQRGGYEGEAPYPSRTIPAPDTAAGECNGVIQADEIFVREYMDIVIRHRATHKALIDSGFEICCVARNLVKGLDVPVVKQVKMSGLQGGGGVADVIRLQVKPSHSQVGCVNVAPSVNVWFAVVPYLNEEVIITPPVAELLRHASRYDVISDPANTHCGRSRGSARQPRQQNRRWPSFTSWRRGLAQLRPAAAESVPTTEGTAAR